MIFKEKFVKYLTDGIPIHIPDDEVFIFYKELKNFINKADNDFIGFYETGDEEVVISDISQDYLRISYSDNKIIFKQPAFSSIKDSVHNLFMAGQAFLGVIVFIESLSPSEDSTFIETINNDIRQF